MCNKYGTYQLGEVADIIAGGDKPKIFSLERTSSVYVPVLANAEKNNGLLGYTNTPRIVESAVTVAARGSNVGFVAIRKEPFFPVVRLLSLIPNRERLDVDYLFYDLKQNRKKGTGSGQPQITIPDIASKTISLPPLSFQKKVAKVLSTLDAKIELNNRINQQLEEMAKTLYDYWFVQFDFPDENGKPYKSSGGKMVYNEVLKREIPEGWEVDKLGNIAQIKKGTLITEKTTNPDGEIKVVSAGINYSYYHDTPNFLPNTITISASGANAGYINFWRESIFACDCTTVRGKTDQETLIILQFLKMRQEYIYQQARGSAQPHVYPKDIEILNMEIPPQSLIELFGKSVLSSNKKQTFIIKENQQLANLRDWLLPMLMNGQVKVA
jgi:type I restriction enzyme S subunit